MVVHRKRAAKDRGFRGERTTQPSPTQPPVDAGVGGVLPLYRVDGRILHSPSNAPMVEVASSAGCATARIALPFPGGPCETAPPVFRLALLTGCSAIGLLAQTPPGIPGRSGRPDSRRRARGAGWPQRRRHAGHAGTRRTRRCAECLWPQSSGRDEERRARLPVLRLRTYTLPVPEAPAISICCTHVSASIPSGFYQKHGMTIPSSSSACSCSATSRT